MAPRDIPSELTDDEWALDSEDAVEIEDFPALSEPIQEGGREPGPCLYFGPGGQRCSRPSLDGSFCASHGTRGGVKAAMRDYGRVLAATVAIVALLWPYLHDVVREILQWLYSS
jgi:hypothetical protein